MVLTPPRHQRSNQHWFGRREYRVPEQQWKRFAKQIEEERNPGRIAELAKELNEAMLTEEREKVRNRLRMPPKIGKEVNE